MLDLFRCLDNKACNTSGIIRSTKSFASRLTVVHPMQVTAGTLRHDSNHGLVAADFLFQQFGNFTKVVGRKTVTGPEVVH